MLKSAANVNKLFRHLHFSWLNVCTPKGSVILCSVPVKKLQTKFFFTGYKFIPFHQRKNLEACVESLLQQDITEPADGPTLWVSPVVLVPKPKQPGGVQLCVDMREANKAITRERHLMPTLDEVVHDLNGAKVFSKVDLN